MVGSKQRGFAGIAQRANDNTLSFPTQVTSYSDLTAQSVSQRSHSVPNPAKELGNPRDSNQVVSYGDTSRIAGLNWKRIGWTGASILVGALVLSGLIESNRPAPSRPSYPGLTAAVTSEVKPPIGNGTLFNEDQIRYCLREKIRLEAAEPFVSSDAQITIFNIYVDDYNSRCMNFRYRRGQLEAVQMEVARDKARLESEGIARMP